VVQVLIAEMHVFHAGILSVAVGQFLTEKMHEFHSAMISVVYSIVPDRGSA
jgi:hypothetical protein